VQTSLDPAGAISASSIAAHAEQMGLTLLAEQSERLERFIALLLRWNRTHNLTAITRPQQVLSLHLLDSLSAAVELPADPPLRVLDAGSGAGLPGIPLAIALPQHHFTLVDAVAKKCAFVTQACVELDLKNVEPVHGRLEELRGAGYQGRFDVIVARAFGTLATLVEVSRHLLAPSGRWIAMKGLPSEQEQQRLPHDVEVVRTVPLHVPLLHQARSLVVLQIATPH